jgi:aspartyl-tRNA(Asn)/glutamyl-tRNA(Gln) amidotransferase subunit B
MSKTAYTPVIGLETHAELKTASKMFCSCQNDPFGAEKPNTHTCPVCLGMPGALPVANKKAIEWTIKIGLALHCKINLFSKFDRKNYFYPDLPKGYQISQYDLPFCYDGYIDTSEGRIRIRRIHLEEDTAKMIHEEVDLGDGKGKRKVSLIDFNRSSVPLVEIVTEPDIKTGSQAKEYGQKLRQILRYLDVANCDMEKGGMRLEANISLQKPGQQDLPNYKVECKNINSFRFLEAAIDFEIKRQADLLDKGETPKQETRGYNPTTGHTFSQRSKEDAEDYRYFPDPDLPPFEFSAEQIEAWRAELPELPDEKATRLQKTYQLTEKMTDAILSQHQHASFYEEVLAAAAQAQLEPSKLLNALINKKLDFHFDENPESIIAKFQALQTTESVDQAELDQAIAEVLANNQDAVEKFKSGKTQVIGFLLGQTMRTLGKKLDSKLLQEALLKALE